MRPEEAEKMAQNNLFESNKQKAIPQKPRRTYQQYMLSRLKMTEAEARKALVAIFGLVRPPLVVSCGLGVDSVAVLVGFHQRGIRPDLTKFADTGGEKQKTYDYLPILNDWCRRVGFPEIISVRANSKYQSLYDECWKKRMLPSIAYGGHSCSDKWKQAPLVKYSNNWMPARLAWACGLKIIRVIGYDASPRDCARMAKAVTYVAKKGDHKHEYFYPLQEWGWTRERCEIEIANAGLPIPLKSSCTFCQAMKRQEIIELRLAEPESYYANLALERRAIESGQLKSVKGLGRSFSWNELERELTSEAEECLINFEGMPFCVSQWDDVGNGESSYPTRLNLCSSKEGLANS